MKAPDKMYFNLPNPEEGGDFFPYWTENAEKADNVISEAYIRKEALIEWLEKANEQALIEQGEYNTGTTIWEEVIDKINSL